MDALPLLREQLTAAHDFLETTLGDPTPEQLHFCPPGHALPIGAAYAHVIFSEDMLIQGLLKHTAPLFAASSEPTGASEPMPGFGPEWAGYEEWTRRVRFDLPQLRRYAQRVYAASDAYLASLKESDLQTPFDLSNFDLGQQNLAWFIARIVISHVDNLTGEISAVKGVQGLKGYPV
jgi:hypothetical protein